MSDERNSSKHEADEDVERADEAEDGDGDGDGEAADAAERAEPAPKPKKERAKAAASKAPAEPVTGRRTVMLALASGFVVGAAAGFGGGYYWAKRRRSPRERPPEIARAYVELAPWSARKGPNPAKVTIVEFSDFQ